MAFSNRKRLLMLGLGFFLLPACLNVKEEIFLNQDGSGRLEVEYSMKKEHYRLIPPEGNFPATEADVYEKFQELEGVEIEKTDLRREGDNVVMSYALSFQDLTAFNNNNYQFTFNDDGTEKVFQLRVRGGGLEDQPVDAGGRKQMFNEAMSQALTGFNLRVHVHFPGPVVESNAQVVEGQKAEWTVAMWDLHRADYYTLQARVKVRKTFWEKLKGLF